MQALITRLMTAIIMMLVSVFSNFPGLPAKPAGQNLNLEERFDLTWNDEFDGDAIDTTKWIDNQSNVPSVQWGALRCGGYWHKNMLEVNDGCLTIKTRYIDGGLDGLPSAYYTAMISTSTLFEQKYGYFETRCILPSATGMWSAFWMMNEGVYNADGSGQDGTEVDVFESMSYKDVWWGAGNCVSTGIHYDGYGDAHKNASIGKFFADEPYTKFNTYGVEWNPDEYIFYINGVETGRMSDGGVSQNPEFLILSCEVAGKNGIADADRHGTAKIDLGTENEAKFIVDYVRAYQYKNLSDITD